MRRFVISLALAVLCIGAYSQRTGQAQQAYIDAYSGIAIEEMIRTGVPASITLAQGLLESGAGLSKLAVEGNNHFGIKCHKGWTGKTIYIDDDRRGECFRVYESADESFRDHSDFLRYRDRYKFLFDLDLTDYRGWAHGLKKAGYATDPKYAGKLIKYIEDYNLARFDIVTTQEAAIMPESPLKIEQPVAVPEVRNGVSVPASEQFHFPLSRKLYSLNNVPFVYSMEGETYRSIAKQYHLFKWEILKYNDLKEEQPLLPGTIVYLQAKKKSAPKGLEMYIVEEDGEDFHAICQRFAVKEKAVLKLNGWVPPVQLEEGDEIKLR